MKTLFEHEAKILNVDAEMVIARLDHLGAEKILEDKTYMEGYDFDPEFSSGYRDVPAKFQEIVGRINKLRDSGNMFSHGAYLRLRREGSKYELIFKQKIAVDSMVKSEVEISILIQKDEWDAVVRMLLDLGLKKIATQEKKRTSFRYLSFRYDIDTWPGVPTYLEVEAPSPQDVLEAIAILGFAHLDIVSMTAAEVFEKYGVSNPLYLIFNEN